MTPAEAVSCYLVLLLGSWPATWAFVEAQMPLLTSPYVFASPENGWREHLLPHLPAWALGPAVEPYASGFYNGLPDDVARPWALWLRPVLAWTAFAVALAAFGAGLAALLSRQWIEHDRLTFPMAEVVIRMARGAMHDRRFWWGVAAAAALPLYGTFQAVVPVFPRVSLYFGAGAEGIEWLKGATRIVTVLSIPVLGLYYFVHRDIILSMVLCFFVLALENYGLGLAGVKLEHNDVFGWGGSATGWQTAGSILALVVFGLWAGRRPILDFVRAGLKGEDRDGGWLSPRVALVALIGGAAALGVWMIALGLRSPGPLLAFLGSQALGYMGMARLTAESGMEVNWPIEPTGMALLAGGTAMIAPAGFAALALSESWVTGTGWLSVASIGLQGEKIRSQVKFGRRVLTAGLLAVAISTAVSMLATAKLGYDRGANNFGNWSYQWHMRIPYDQATECVRSATGADPVGVDWTRAGWLGGGALLASALIFLRNHVVGWFLHPLGLVLGALGVPGGSQGNVFVFTALIAWSVKSLILKLGGVESYERLKPLFAGFVVGHYLPDVLGAVADVISYMMVGHPLT